MPDLHARTQIEKREAALYFNESGVLDLPKWLAILQQREADLQAANDKVDAIIEQSKKAVPYPAHALFISETMTGGLSLTKSTSDEQEAFGWHEAVEAWESGQGVQLTPTGPFLSKSKGDQCPQVIYDVKEHIKARNEWLSASEYDTAIDTWEDLNALVTLTRQIVTIAPAYTLHDCQAKLAAYQSYCGPDLDPNDLIGLQSLQADLSRIEAIIQGAAA